MENNLYLNNFEELSTKDLNIINGGGFSLDWVGDAFVKIYNCGKDFGRN